MTFLEVVFIVGILVLNLFEKIESKERYELKGSTIVFNCPIIKTSNTNLIWNFVSTTSNLSVPYTINDRINDQYPGMEVFTRLSVVGDHTQGIYNLQIRDIRESDEGIYTCYIGPNNTDKQQLYLIVPPSSVNIHDVTVSNRLVGTEDTDLNVSCSAVGGQPPPLVTLTIDGSTVASNNQSVQHTVQSIARTLDKKLVRCEAKNEANTHNPKINSSTIYLNLKPLEPTIQPNIVGTNETKPLIVTCTSQGSRPAAVIHWTIGQTDVTSHSTNQSAQSADETYTVTSTLTYIVDRSYNNQTITCAATNVVLPGGRQSSRVLDIKFSPYVTVTNVTHDSSTFKRNVTCRPVGNPPTYTYYKWQHKSKYGELIRELDGGQNGVLTLPDVPKAQRYQDTGEYRCTVSNGITGKDGNLQQSASGYVTVNGLPIVTSDSKDRSYGQIGNNTDIHVYLYIIPKYSTYRWYKVNTELPTSTDKYSSSIIPAIVNDTFHNHTIQLDGYRSTLTIYKLEEEDFNTTYSLKVSNGVGENEYMVVLLSASSPEIPLNFTVVDITSSSIVVEWLPGYNGGDDQTFFIEYRELNVSERWLKHMVSNSNQQVGLTSDTLTDLQSNTVYEIRMYAKNVFGVSKRTILLKIQTLLSIKTAKASVAGVIGGVTGGLLGIIIILVILAAILFKKRKAKSDNTKVEDELIENILYQSQPLDYKPKTNDENTREQRATAYADVQKPNAMYAEVDKSQHKNVKGTDNKVKKMHAKKTDKIKKNAKKNNIEGDYSNAGFPLNNMETEYANSEEKNATENKFTNADGLQYADLDLSFVKGKKGKHVIHGAENRTIYAAVDHSKTAPPPPLESEYEETNIKHGNLT